MKYATKGRDHRQPTRQSQETTWLVDFGKQFITRKPNNWWGSAKRDDTCPRATVVYNGYYCFFQIRLRRPMHLLMCDERDNNTKIAIFLKRRRRQVHLSSVFFLGGGSKAKQSIGLHNRKCSTWITLSISVNLFEIDGTSIEKSRAEHDPKWTR